MSYAWTTLTNNDIKIGLSAQVVHERSTDVASTQNEHALAHHIRSCHLVPGPGMSHVSCLLGTRKGSFQFQFYCGGRTCWNFGVLKCTQSLASASHYLLLLPVDVRGISTPYFIGFHACMSSLMNWPLWPHPRTHVPPKALKHQTGEYQGRREGEGLRRSPYFLSATA